MFEPHRLESGNAGVLGCFQKVFSRVVSVVPYRVFQRDVLSFEGGAYRQCVLCVLCVLSAPVHLCDNVFFRPGSGEKDGSACILAIIKCAHVQQDERECEL